jgi:hypothetical protein
MIDIRTLKTYRCPYRYHAQKGSAFLSLYQPDKGPDYKFLYHESHLKMWRHAEKSITIREGYVCFSVHDQNSSTFISPHAEQIKL